MGERRDGADDGVNAGDGPAPAPDGEGGGLAPAPDLVGGGLAPAPDLVGGGLAPAPDLEARAADLPALDAALQATGDAAWAALQRRGACHPRAVAPTLSFPQTFGATLAAALALEAAEGDAAADERAARLRAHYLQSMPTLRVEQLGRDDPPSALLLHARLDWSRLPRTRGALEGAFALLAACGVPAAGALPAPDLDALTRRHETLAELHARCHFGGCMPMLLAAPGDLAAMASEVAAGASRWAVIDRLLSGPLLHELMHLAPTRRACSPPYLDECIAGHLGVRLTPWFLCPPPGEAGDGYAAAWFAQVGQALVRCFGLAPVVRAHAGVIPWEAALGAPFVTAAAALGWERHRRERALHFLSGNTEPQPWIKLACLAAAGDPLVARRPDLATLRALDWSRVPPPPPDPAGDRALLDTALRALCVESARQGLIHRVRRRASVDLVLDTAGQCARGQARGADPAPPWHWVPPGATRGLTAPHPWRVLLRRTDDDALAWLADAITRGAPRFTTTHTIEPLDAHPAPLP